MVKIFLDNSATTPTDKKVFEAMKPWFLNDFGNPSSIHSFGVKAKNAVEDARKVVAGFLNARSKEIIFTSGGTEANNLAIFGTVQKLIDDGRKPEEIEIITTEIEHSSVLECLKELEKRGVKIKYLSVSPEGLVEPRNLRKIINKNTALVTVGYANSEIGTVQLVREIAKEIRHARKGLGIQNRYPYFHIDASQAGQYLNMNVEELGVDLVTLDAQKMYGPKGVGALFVKDGIQIKPMIFGGGQENGMRAGTENVALIAGFAKAIEICRKGETLNLKKGLSLATTKEAKRVGKLKDEFFEQLKKFVPSAIINGPLSNRLPNNINISIPGKSGEFMVLQLDEEGIICSSASACESDLGSSRVVKIIASKSDATKEEISKRAEGSLRFSLGRSTKSSDIKKLLKSLQKLI